MSLSVFFALMVGSPSHPPHRVLTLSPTHPPTSQGPAPTHPPPPPVHGTVPGPRPGEPCLSNVYLAFTVHWKQPAWLHMLCPRVGPWT